MNFLEKRPRSPNVREISFKEIILNNVKNRLTRPANGSLLKISLQEFRRYKEYIEYLIDQEFKLGLKTKPNISNIRTELVIKIRREVKQAKEDYLRTFEKAKN